MRRQIIWIALEFEEDFRKRYTCEGQTIDALFWPSPECWGEMLGEENRLLLGSGTRESSVLGSGTRQSSVFERPRRFGSLATSATANRSLLGSGTRQSSVFESGDFRYGEPFY